MRFLSALCLLGMFLLSGCASPDADATKSPGAPTEKPSKPTLTPVAVLSGKIVLVNPALRYVVVDFSVGRMPLADQRLGVYRNGQKVGEIKVSSQFRDSNVAADILAGQAAVGDTVRED